MMTRPTVLVRLTLIGTALVSLLTVFDFLALHDISADYISREALRSAAVVPSVPLPDWTATASERRTLLVGWFARVGFLALNAVTLVACARAMGSRPR